MVPPFFFVLQLTVIIDSSNLCAKKGCMKLLGWILSMVLSSSLCQPNVWAHEEITVTNDGTIRGTVTLESEQPRPMAFNLVTIPDPVFVASFPLVI